MQLIELPVGSSFQFAESALKKINTLAAKWDDYFGGAAKNPYRIVNDPKTPFRVSGIGDKPTVMRDSKGVFYGDSPTLEVVEVNAQPLALFNPDGHLPDRSVFTTSCDPEIFMVDERENVIPAFSVLDQKHRLNSGSNSFFYSDGFQAELSPQPEHCHELVLRSVFGLLFEMRTRVAKASGKAVRYSWRNLVEIPAETLQKATDAQVSLGCEPSENIYGTTPFVVDNPREFPYRMAGGHIHLGAPAVAKFLHARAEPIITAMDAFAGVASVALFEGMEDPRRRQYYGRAGEFRFQPHGLEYRTLSNAWLVASPVAHLVFNLARGAFRMGFMNWREVLKLDSLWIRDIIDGYNVPEARKFISAHSKQFAWLLTRDSGYTWHKDALKLMALGVQSQIPNWRERFAEWSEGPETFQAGRASFFAKTRKSATGWMPPTIGGAQISQRTPAPAHRDVPNFQNLNWPSGGVPTGLPERV